MAEKKAKEKGTLLQLVLFIALSTIAAGVQWVIAYFGEGWLLKISDKLAAVILTGSAFEQTIAAFIGFLVSNIVAKLLSYFLNRKTTFGARKYLAFSLSMFIVLSVILIVVETIIAIPLANAIFGGPQIEKFQEITPDQANAFGYWMHTHFLIPKDSPNGFGDGWGWCKLLAIILYSLVDLIIVFIMNKLVIMNDHIFDSKEERAAYKAEKAKAKEEKAAAKAAKKSGKAVEVKDEVKEEAPVEEAKEEPKHEQAIEEDVVITPADEAKFEEEEKAAEEAKAKEEAEAKAKKEAEEKAAAEAKAKEEAEAKAKKEAEEKAAAEAKAKAEEEAKAKAEAEAKAAEEAKKEEVKEEPKAEEPAKEEVKEEAPKAAEKKAPAKKAATKAKNAGKVEFELRVDGYHFEVSAMNGQLMFESQGFASAETAKSGFDTFKAALEDPETPTSVYQDKRGLWRFVINKRYVGEGYKTRAQAEAAIESVKRDALFGTVLDIEEDPEEKKAYAAAKKNFNKGTGVDWDKVLKAPAKTFGKFEITGHEGRGFFFTLYANNGQILYCSRYYASEDSCEDAITTFKKACYLNNFFIDKDKFGNWRFVLKGTGAGICYYGESYSTKDAAISSSESVKKFAMTAKIVVVDDED